MISQPSLSRPHVSLTLLEAPRALSEYVSFTAAGPLLTARRSGCGRPVLVLPGYTADDRSTGPLRRFLQSVGYAAYGWGLGKNVGLSSRIVSGVDAVLDEVTAKHGGPVSVIGQSLGGVLGHDVAHRHPGAVDRLITLGSPLYVAGGNQSRGSSTHRYYSPAQLDGYATGAWSPPPLKSVPVTSIFSKTDGVVRWETCLHPPGPLAENIEVHASHCGMGFHLAVAYAVLDRLAVPTDSWHEFAPPAYLSVHFPTPPEITELRNATEVA